MGGFTTLVGILVHSAADGIALGAAAFAENAATGALISLAIILHKVRVDSMRNTHAHPSGPFLAVLGLQRYRLTLDAHWDMDAGAHRVRAEHFLAQEVCSIPRHPLSSHTRCVYRDFPRALVPSQLLT
jgi:hypothetical protein